MAFTGLNVPFPMDHGLFPGEQPADYIGGQIQRVSAEAPKSRPSTASATASGSKARTTSSSMARANFYFTDHGKTRPRDRDRTGVFYASPTEDDQGDHFPMEARTASA